MLLYYMKGKCILSVRAMTQTNLIFTCLKNIACLLHRFLCSLWFVHIFCIKSKPSGAVLTECFFTWQLKSRQCRVVSSLQNNLGMQAKKATVCVSISLITVNTPKWHNRLNNRLDGSV